MAYIKISDPNIIDLPTIHQIINVVNQHSDNISSLTNNFGSVYNANPTSGPTTQYQFDLASQQIMYGRTSITTGASGSADFDNAGGYDITIPFTGQSFAGNPFVVASITYSGGASFHDVIVKVTSSSPQNFIAKVRSATKTTNWLGTSKVYINWIAIGSK